MAARFAGSRHLDERRRRRLAGEQDAAAQSRPSAENSCSRPAVSSAPRASRDAASRPIRGRRFPLRRIISPRLWKHAAAGLFAFALAAAVVWAGWHAGRIGRRLGPAAEAFFALPGGRAAAGCGGLLMLASALLALMIYFVRSRSRADFAGRYRVWAWTAAIAFFAGVTILTGLHRVWARTLAFVLHLDVGSAETWFWLAPLLGCTSVLLRDLQVDMRRCRASGALLCLAILGWTSAVVQSLGYGIGLDDRVHAAAVAGLTLFGHWSLFTGLLLHARFVLFVSSEPPPSCDPLWKRLLHSAAGAFVRWKARAAERKRTKAAQLARGASEPDAENERVTETTGRKTPRKSTDNAPPSKSASGPAKVRIDAAHAAMPPSKHLSKRERRRLRKQQRAASGSRPNAE